MVNSLNTILAYQKGVSTSIRDVRKATNGCDIQIVLAFDKRFICKKRAICKSCRTHHKKGCCENYGRLNRTSHECIENCMILISSPKEPKRPKGSNLDAYLEYKEKLTRPYRCECGSIVQHCGKATHRKSKKHIVFNN